MDLCWIWESKNKNVNFKLKKERIIIMNSENRMLKRQFYLNNKVYFFISIICLIIKAACQVVFAYWVQRLFDISVEGNMNDLLQTAIYIIIYFIIVVVNELILHVVKNQFIKKAMYQYKDYVFGKIINKNISQFRKRESAQYMSMLVSDTQLVEKNYVIGEFEIIFNLVMLVMALAMMIYYNIIMFFVALICSLLPLFIASALSSKLVKLEKDVSKGNEIFMGKVRGFFDGFTVLKSFKAENEVISLFHRENIIQENIGYIRKKMNDLINLIIFNSATIFHVILFIVGVFLTINGHITSGILMAFVQLMNYVLNPVQDLSSLYANYKSAGGLINKMGEVVAYQKDDVKTVTVNKLNNKIRVEDLSFGYEKNNLILKNINLDFELGKSYAIIGGSGSGKSTLINVLMGNCCGYLGHVLVDDKELNTIQDDCIYDLISIIEQNVFVFDDTIKNNITMFKGVNQDILDNVIEKSGLADKIKDVGYDYLCGEHGKNLSGGERQRISIARALLKNTQILLMDEATSALDSKTTSEVENTILKLNDVMKIVITHKMNPSILKKYDQIIVLSHGKVMELGTYDELIDKKGYLYSLSVLNA